MVQWLGLGSYTASGSIPGCGTKIPQSARPKKKKKGSDEPRGRTGIKTDIENGLEDTGREKSKLG